MAGHGIAGTRLTYKRKTFPEHGTLMAFVVVRPVQTDQNFADWFDTPRDYQSFYDPGLVPLPPVRVDKRDVVPITPDADKNDLVGYQQWGNWYRSALSRGNPAMEDWYGRSTTDPSLWDPSELRNINPVNYNILFNNDSASPGEHYQVAAVHALRALRAIPRTNIVGGAASPGAAER